MSVSINQFEVEVRRSADDRWYHTATLLTDGRVLITGGDVNPKEPDYTAEIWDPATGKFSPTHHGRFTNRPRGPAGWRRSRG
jgi:hypothetical protein